MKRSDIEHLGTLSRIKLSDTEIDTLEAELPGILDYVSVISDIAGSDTDAAPEVGVRYNVFRTDEVLNQPNQYTEDILREMPDRSGRYMKVKKIISQDE